MKTQAKVVGKMILFLFKNYIGWGDHRFIHPKNFKGFKNFQMRLTRFSLQSFANIFVRNDGVGVFKYLIAKTMVTVIMRVDGV